MEDLFNNRYITPMLIQLEQPPFDSDEYLYELKLDGVRCLAYINQDKVELINKRHLLITNKFPELKDMNKQIKKTCILDGELYVYKDGKPDFFEIQKRTLTSDTFKIRLTSKQSPACFTAFDVLYADGKDLTNLPLLKRKKILSGLVKEDAHFNIARYIERQGIALYELTKQQELEGIVAKRKDSLYHINKKTRDWIKCKNLLDDDFLITGYIIKEKGIISLVLAQYDDHKKLLYKGHVTMGVSLPYLKKHTSKTTASPFDILPQGNDEAIWIKPFLVGTVKFMEYTQSGGLRQPVFKGFRDDKPIEECISKFDESKKNASK